MPARKTSSSQRPKLLHINDYRYIHFMYPYGTSPAPQIITIRMSHMIVSKEDTFIRTHNHRIGECVTGVPVRGTPGLCIESRVEGEAQHIMCSSVEAGVQLPTPTSTHSPNEILEANFNFIREQLDIHFAHVRKALSAKWSFIKFEVYLPGMESWSVLPLQFCPKSPR